MTIWVGAGLIGLVALSTGDLAGRILDDVPNVFTALIVTAIICGGAALALGRVGFEFAQTTVRRNREDTEGGGVSEAPQPEAQGTDRVRRWPLFAELMWRLSLILTAVAGLAYVIAVWLSVAESSRTFGMQTVQPGGRVTRSWPAGAHLLPGGLVSIPIRSTRPPAHLIISEVSFSPDPLRSYQPVVATFRITDTRGFVVRDALVSVLGLRRAGFRPAKDRWTNFRGIARFRLRPAGRLALRDGRRVLLLVRARDPADELLAGVSARRFVRFSVATS